MLGTPFDFDFLERFKIPLKRFAAGEKIFLEEDPGDYMYLVVEGKVSIVTYGTVLENVGLHGIFGELALIDSAPRSAAALAAEATEVALINRDTFLELQTVQDAAPSFTHVHLLVDNLDATIAQLRQAGLPSVARNVTTPGTISEAGLAAGSNVRNANIIDPNGLRLELNEWSAESLPKRAADSWTGN